MAALSHASARAANPTVKLRDGAVVPALGQGSANLAQERRPEAAEEEALRTGLSLGMNLIDTAEMYGGGRSEKLIGRVIAGQRDRVFLVSKVWPNHVAGDGIARACEASLGRLGTDYLDLYLLHWPSREADLSSIVAAFESLRAAGKIRAWGVSNFKVTDMEDLFRVSHGDRCATNQVLYNLASRDIERDLLPWCEQHGMPIMAYSPLGGAGAGLLRDPVLARPRRGGPPEESWSRNWRFPRAPCAFDLRHRRNISTQTAAPLYRRRPQTSSLETGAPFRQRWALA